MYVAEELKLTYKFEWEKKIAAPGSRDWSSRGKRSGELGLWHDQNLSSIYHVKNNGWLDWLMNNNPLRGYIYMNLMTKLD
jgi:hypothetical protein